MKKRVYFITALSLIAISVSSCGFNFRVKTKLSSIKLTSTKSAFSIGQSFFEYSSLSMRGYYEDNTYATLNDCDVSYSLKLAKKTVDINTPFIEAGDYSLTVSRSGIKSNTVKFKVYEEDIYVTSLEVSGVDELTTTGEVTYLDLTVNPTNFTVPIIAESSNTNIASIEKVNDVRYKVKATGTGDITFSFNTLSGEDSPISFTHQMSVTSLSKTTIAQTYNDQFKNNYYTLSSCPLEGEPRLLVIPVWFTDSASYIKESHREKVRNDINSVFFGTTDDTGWHSVNSFFKKESFNELNISGTVSEWYECGRPVEDFEEDTYKTITAEFVKTATNWYFASHEESRQDYDYDGDGYLDGVVLVYAAPDNQVKKSFGENMWAYCSWIGESYQKNIENPGVNVFLWASYDFMYGDNAESRTGKSYGNGDTSYCNLDSHTFIHETGHVLGLDDYYDYSGKTKPAGSFSMQDYNIGGHEAYSLLSFGWADPYIPTESCTINIEEFQTSHDLILLTPSWNSYDSPFDEYLLLELYSPNEMNQFDISNPYNKYFPQGPNAVGIRLWHVDSRLYAKDSSSWTTNALENKIHVGLNNNTNVTSARDKNVCFAGLSNQQYNLLQLIRNNSKKTYLDGSYFASGDLFKEGSSFDIDSLSKQFVKDNLLDTGVTLGWSFTVKSIKLSNGTYSARISLVRE